MKLSYDKAKSEDIEPICQLSEQLIRDYENLERMDFTKLRNWVWKKVTASIDSYTVIYADGKKAGYYHFYRNDDDVYEIDDLYVFPAFQNKGIGSAVIRACCGAVCEPVMLYVFIQNRSAVALYKRLGFEVVKTINDNRYIMRRDPNQRKYYAAYDERYKTAHARGVSWACDVSTPIVMEIIRKYQIQPHDQILEIGCGEGRDARTLLERGYRLAATDLSEEAIAYCKQNMPRFEDCFSVLDCLSGTLDVRFDFIYAVAVIHMLVPDADRDGFYQFVYGHLAPGGIGLICSMGDGAFESQSDISQAFTLQERNHESGNMLVAGTSCRMVSFRTFEAELQRNKLDILESGITASLPNFNSLMYAVVKKA